MRPPLYGTHPVSPRQHLEAYSKTHDWMERECRPSEKSAYKIFVWCSVALALWGVWTLIW